MLAITLSALIAAVILVLLASKKTKAFGSKLDEVERRHPSSPFEDEDEILLRRKDDSVGGEGG